MSFLQLPPVLEYPLAIAGREFREVAILGQFGTIAQESRPIPAGKLAPIDETIDLTGLEDDKHHHQFIPVESLPWALFGHLRPLANKFSPFAPTNVGSVVSTQTTYHANVTRKGRRGNPRRKCAGRTWRNGRRKDCSTGSGGRKARPARRRHNMSYHNRTRTPRRTYTI